MTVLQTMAAETSLYDDHSYSGSMSGESSQNSPSETSSAGGGSPLKRPTAISLNSATSLGGKSVSELKKNLHLDFASPESTKKTLATPDIVRFLQLASPELEKFITQSVANVTTPTPTNFLFPKTVTSEQEQYARGFIDALNAIHQSNNFSPGANLLSPAGVAAALAANTAAAAAAKQNSTSSTNNSAQESAVTIEAQQSIAASTSGNAIPNSGNSKSAGSKSPINPGVTSSVIMSTVGFPVSMSNALNNFNNYGSLFSAGLHGTPSPMSNIPAAMALFNLQNAGNKLVDQKTVASAILQEDRPPSQSAESASMEFTTLTQASTLPPAAAGATASSGSFQLQANQYLNNVVAATSCTPSPAIQMPQKASRGMVRSGTALIKQEPDQAVPNVNISLDGSFGLPSSSGSSSTVPLDLKEQEALKLERKRHRNRIAATKCRKRKLEKIGDLEEQVKEQEDIKKQLTDSSMELKGEISRLRAELEVHRNNGCPLPLAKLLNSSMGPK